MTKDERIAKAHYSTYLKSTDETLMDVYKSCSRWKFIAFNRCRALMEAVGGWELRIISHNSQSFTVGFMFEEDGKTKFAYITKDYDRFCEI